jgi:cytochrome c
MELEKPMFRILLAALALVATTATGWCQDVEAGEKSFRKCAPCHDVGTDAQNKVGPILNGLDGRKAGSVADYSYSDANKNSGFTWDEATFKDYILDPKAKIPNTKMAFAGIKSERERASLWAYLKQFAADGNIKK